MNIAVAPGTSSDRPGDRIEKRHGLRVYVMRPDNPAEMDVALEAYIRGGDDRWSREEFLEKARASWLINFALVRGDVLECTFGLELCFSEDPGLHYWVQFVYVATGFYAPAGVMRRCGGAIVDVCHETARRWCHAAGQEQAAFRLNGRKGWERILKAMHIERDELGWIFENQERFRHGLQ